MAWLRIALRRLRDDLPATVGFAVLVLVTAGLASAMPRILAAQADQSVRAEVGAATASQRNVVVIRHVQSAQSLDGDPLTLLREEGAAITATMPARIRGLFASHDLVVESGRYRIGKTTTDPAFVRLRIQEGVEDHLAYTSGRAPTAVIGRRDDVGPMRVDNAPVYEASVSVATAARFSLALDEVIPLAGDSTDPLVGRAREAFAFVRITGIYEVTDPDAEYWLDDPLLIHPIVRALSAELQLLDAALVVDPATCGTLLAGTGHEPGQVRVSWRSFVAADRISARSAPDLARDLRRLTAAYPSANVTLTNDTGLRTGLLAVLDRHQAAWSAAESLVAVLLLGPAAVAVATMALIAILSGARRRSTMTLVRSRGASTVQVLGAVLAEGALIVVPAMLVALAVVIVVVPAGRILHAGIAAALAGGAAVAVVAATVMPVLRGQGAAARDQDRIAGIPVRGRRLVAELLVVVLAVGGALLLRERGVRSVGPGGAVAGFDPLIAAVPALVGLAAGLLAIRLYPLAMRVVAALGRRSRGLVLLLAARRGTEGGATAAVLLVLLATATVGSFALTALDQLGRGAELGAWRETGAAFRVAAPSGGLPASYDGSRLPGVEATAGEYQGVIPFDMNGPLVLFAAPDAAALERVLAGTPIQPDFPAGFADPEAGPIPAIVSSNLLGIPNGATAGGVFMLSVEGFNLEYRAVEVRDSFPGLPEGRPFVVVAREAVAAAAPAARMVPVVSFLRAPVDSVGALRAAVEPMGRALRVGSQAELAEARRGSPVTAAVRALVLAAALVTIAYAALGVAAALALAGVSRSGETARLRTMGLTPRALLALSVAEHGPSTLTAFAAGIGLGVGLFTLLRDALGLAGLTGAPPDVPVVVDPALMLLLLVAMAAVVAAGVLLGTWFGRRLAPATVLRGRFD